VSELIAESAPRGARDEAGDVDHLHRDEAGAIAADAHVRRTALVELGSGAVDADVRLADGRVDRGERIRALGHVVHGVEKNVDFPTEGLPTRPIR